MTDCKPCATPADTTSKHSATDGALLPNGTFYCSFAGALQYLAFTKSCITYVVQQVCLFKHAPHESYFAFMKWILRYLSGTIDFGLWLVPSRSSSLIAYLIGGRYPDSRLSTFGYYVFLGDNLISISQATIS